MSPLLINTLAELQAEQDRIQENMRLSRQHFFQSADRTAAAGRAFLLKEVLLPVGAIGLGAFLVKKVSDYADAHTEMPTKVQAVLAPKEQNAGWFSKLMVVALPFLQQFFLKKKPAEQLVEGGEGDRIYASGEKENATAGWLSTLVPIVIPLAQQYFLHRAEHANEQPMTVDFEDEGVVEGSFTKKEDSSAIFEPLFNLLPVVLTLVLQHFNQEKRTSEAGESNADDSNNGRYAEAMA